MYVCIYVVFTYLDINAKRSGEIALSNNEAP